MPANERGSASLSIVHRPDKDPKEVFIDGWLDFERDTIDTDPFTLTAPAERGRLYPQAKAVLERACHTGGGDRQFCLP